MGGPPAVLIVVRHGARLDAADKLWHLSSPTPYDPPLTYGGWTQSRALGARIASILRSRETDDDIPPTNQDVDNGKVIGDRRRRRHKVIIHSSPFLRCVQTSIAISAGLAQNPGRTRSRPSSAHSSRPYSYSSPRARPTISTESPRLTPIHEPISPFGNGVSETDATIRKSTLRVDAFLGEWLSPDYFELITPPPGSVMMVAGAKADLLRLEDYNHLSQVREMPPISSAVGFPGGWGSPVIAPETVVEDGPLSSISTLSQSLPRRERSVSSNSSDSRQNISIRTISTMPPTNAADQSVYHPPIPSHTILNSDPIPTGFAAHARDACVDVDYQWDSMREPLNWGDGGDYGEEWSSMHRRFRKGLQSLVQWYKETEDASELITRLQEKQEEDEFNDAEDMEEDDETDLVVILVTHGAGCNALIGALTNQPVLMDVGMASLTMAVHKSPSKLTPGSTPSRTPKAHSRTSSRTLAIPDEYDIKLVANTEHLRPSSATTPSSSRAPSLPPISTYRQRYNPSSGAQFTDGFAIESSRSIPTSGNFGSIRRTATVATNPSGRAYSNSPVRPSIGLWSAPRSASESLMEEPGDDLVLNFGDESAVESPPSKPIEFARAEREEDDVAPLGLWGTPRPPGDMEGINREFAPKRRWTVNEKSTE